MSPFYRFAARGAIIPFLKAVSKQHVQGTEYFPPTGGFIAVANHLSDLDSLTAMRALVDVDIPVYSLAKSTLFKVPVLGSILRAGGQIPVQRATDKASNSLAAAEKVLHEGGVIMVFPEGTLSRDPLKWPMTGKTGAARLAMTTGVPVVPMGQWGAHTILDTYSKRLRPVPRKRVEIRVGPTLDLSRFGRDISDRRAVRQCTAAIMRAITVLVEEIRGEKAPRPFDMHYDGDPGKGKIGVRRPDPAPQEADPTARESVDEAASKDPGAGGRGGADLPGDSAPEVPA